jgi:hypothetical protein
MTQNMTCQVKIQAQNIKQWGKKGFISHKKYKTPCVLESQITNLSDFRTRNLRLYPKH